MVLPNMALFINLYFSQIFLKLIVGKSSKIRIEFDIRDAMEIAMRIAVYGKFLRF